MRVLRWMQNFMIALRVLFFCQLGPCRSLRFDVRGLDRFTPRLCLFANVRVERVTPEKVDAHTQSLRPPPDRRGLHRLLDVVRYLLNEFGRDSRWSAETAPDDRLQGWQPNL